MKNTIIRLLVAIAPIAVYAVPFCPFCDPLVLESQAFYEDEFVQALYTHEPVFPGHCLVIPKRHVERFELLTEEEISHIGETIKKVDLAVQKVFGTNPYFLLQKNGREVGQSVPHVHFHYIPRKTGDDSQLLIVYNMIMAKVKKPISPEEMKSIVERLEVAIHDL